MSSWDELIKAFESGMITNKDNIEYEYRVYYNRTGEIYKTTALKDAPIEDENYLIVSADQFNNPQKYLVKNKCLVTKPTYVKQTYQLAPSTFGFKVVKKNPALILLENEYYNDIEYYDYRNFKD
jgi:hypothetical protein